MLPAMDGVDLKSVGVGPVTELPLAEAIDHESALKGEEIFHTMCVACHKVEQRFVGPPMKGITRRRRPEWIMNMILNPSEMIQRDSLAQTLFFAFDGMPMSNMGLTKEQARDVLEYLRKIDQALPDQQLP